jgi:phosphoribosyl 1,2-cyclic phosphate phosphodiesterase
VNVSLEFLGTGTSSGVPAIGCDCAVCQSSDVRDQRLRASVLFRVGDTTILIDTSPDLRQQALRSGFRHLDAVLFTHAHADHTAGLDELRAFNGMQQEHIPIWATEATGAELQTRFAYAFANAFPRYGVAPDLTLNVIDGPFDVGPVRVTPLPILHGWLPILGFRIGDVAYMTDLKTIPDETRPLLEDLDVLVITALSQGSHPAHLTLAEALGEVASIGAQRTYLTHIAHGLGLYEQVAPTLPQNVFLALDGMKIESPVTHSTGVSR